VRRALDSGHQSGFGHGVDATQSVSATHSVVKRPRRVDFAAGVRRVFFVVNFLDSLSERHALSSSAGSIRTHGLDKDRRQLEAKEPMNSSSS